MVCLLARGQELEVRLQRQICSTDMKFLRVQESLIALHATWEEGADKVKSDYYRKVCACLCLVYNAPTHD